MKDTNIESLDRLIELAISNWFNNLTQFLNAQFSENKKVIIIALSRKMPRLLECIKKNYLTVSQRETLKELLANPECEFTTEIAIPFLFSDTSAKESTILILDDLVVNANTLSMVCDEIIFLTNCIPYYLSIFNYKRHKVRFSAKSVSKILGSSTPVIAEIDIIRMIAHRFSSDIAENELPTDLEFPIIKYNEILEQSASSDDTGLQKKIADKLISSYPGFRHYSHRILNGEFKGQSITTVLIDDKITPIFNSDFAKVRLFPCHKGCYAVSYAPTLLSEQDLTDPDLFSEHDYSLIWQTLLSNTIENPQSNFRELSLSISHRRRNIMTKRYYHSLVTLANYLFSLSIFSHIGLLLDLSESAKNSIAKNHQPFAKGEITMVSVSLLTGREIAEIITPILNKIIEDQATCKFMRHLTTLQDILAPKGNLAQYKSKRIEVSLKTDKIEDALTEVFILNSQLNVNFGGEYRETFKSLYSIPRPKFHFPNADLDVNNFIDMLIDNGYVVPTYNDVYTASQGYFWRRFFRGNHITPLMRYNNFRKKLNTILAQD